MRCFEVDWDDAGAVQRHLDVVRARLRELRAPSRRERQQARLAACKAIFETHLDSCFSGLDLSEERQFYVYAHLDPTRKIALGRDGVTTFAATLGMSFFPFYLGKGTGDRCLDLDVNEPHRKICQKIRAMGLEPQVIKVADRLTEREALSMEGKLIDIFGLVQAGGLLARLDEGINKNERRALYGPHLEVLRKLN